MKRIILISSIVASLFATGNYQIGASFGRAHTTKGDNSYNFGSIRVGKYLKNNNLLRLELERSSNYNMFSKKGELTRTFLNIEHDFNQKFGFIPYVFGGPGYQWINEGDKNALVLDLGIGTKYNLVKTLSLFAEAKALRDFGIDKNHFGVEGGLIYDFGNKEKNLNNRPKLVDDDKDGVANCIDKCPNTPKGVKVDANGCPIDSDEDGIPDYLDKCPNTPKCVKVDANGCPIDSDKDGVPDYLDKCPNTPKGVKVDINGCPIDSDVDGVPDYLDKCPDTPIGMKVDKNGCAISFDFEIHFDYKSAKIKPEYMPRIKEFAEFLKKHPDIKAEIQGYTDSKGNYEYNIILSEKRAKAVYEALIKLGVNKKQLLWAGYGPNNPVAANDTPEGRAKNRRVVAKLIY